MDLRESFEGKEYQNPANIVPNTPKCKRSVDPWESTYCRGGVLGVHDAGLALDGCAVPNYYYFRFSKLDPVSLSMKVMSCQYSS